MSAFLWALVLHNSKIIKQLKACRHSIWTGISTFIWWNHLNLHTLDTASLHQTRYTSVIYLSSSIHSLTLKSVLKENMLSIQLWTHTHPYRCLWDNQQMTQSEAGLPWPHWVLAHPCGKACSVHSTGLGVVSKEDGVHLKWPPLQRFQCKMLNSPKWRAANAKISE